MQCAGVSALCCFESWDGLFCEKDSVSSGIATAVVACFIQAGRRDGERPAIPRRPLLLPGLLRSSPSRRALPVKWH
jgi:hypothetical protein